MNTEDRPATRDTDSPYPREGLELVVPEEEPAPKTHRGVIPIVRKRIRPSDDSHRGAPRRLPGWLARLVGR